jgi:flagellin
VNISEMLQEDGSVGDTEFFSVIFDRLGVRVHLTGDNVPGAPRGYADGALDTQQLVVEEESGLAFQVGPSGTSNDVSRVGIKDMRASGPILNLTDISIVTIGDAHAALDRLSTAITSITSERNRLGAFQNRLELSIATSEAVVERMKSTESEIREVDIARAVTNLTRSQILSQVATRVATEADTDIERILSLLG